MIYPSNKRITSAQGTFDLNAAINQTTVLMYKGDMDIKTTVRTPFIELKLYTGEGKLVIMRSWVFLDQLNHLFT